MRFTEPGLLRSLPLVGNGQFLSSLPPAPLDDLLPAGRFHARHESVGAEALGDAWLECSFHFKYLFLVPER